MIELIKNENENFYYKPKIKRKFGRGELSANTPWKV